MRRIFSAWAIALAVLVPRAALAQSTEAEPGQAPGWTFTPAVVVGWLRDSNVGMVTEGLGQDIRADNMLVITPSAAMDFFGKHTVFGASYSGTVRRYHDFDTLNSFDQRLRASVSHQATARLQIFGRESFAKVPTTDETELNGVPFRRVGSKVNSGSAGVEYRISKLSTIRATYELVNVDFDREQGLPSYARGGRAHGVSTEYSRRLSEHLALGGIYEIRFAQIKTDAEISQPLRFQMIGPSMRYTLGPATTVSLAGGLSALSDPALADTSIGPFIRAGITHHLQRAIIDGGYERSFVPTFGFVASTRTEQLHGSVLMPVYHNRMYVQATSSWRRNNPLVANEPPLKSFWLSAVAGYAIARPVRIEGYYATAWQDVRGAGGQVNRHRLGVQLVLSAPVRIQ